MHPRKTIVAVLLATATSVTAVAWSAEIDVETTIVGGSRTFAVSSLTGSGLGSLSLGTAGSAGFVSNVTDVRYDTVGYQVVATLSDLYRAEGSTLDCDTTIDSSAFALGFLPTPTSVSGVKALADTIWDVGGTLSGMPPALSALNGQVVTAANVAGNELDSVLGGVFAGAEDTLPVKVSAGSGGAFTSAGPNSTCNPTPASPTSRLVMSGEGNDLAALFAWVESEVADTCNEDGGAMTAANLVSGGCVQSAGLDAAVTAALQSIAAPLGLGPTLTDALGSTTLLGDVKASLTASLDTIASLVGQTGSYTALPTLVSSVPSSVPAGTYRGTLTLTLVDVP